MRITITLLLYMYYSFVSGQEVTVYGQRSLWHADNLCDMQFTGCDYRDEIGHGGILGYGYHPSGQLWLVVAGQLTSENRTIEIYDVNINNCNYTLLYNISLPQYWGVFGSANIDFQGRLYFILSKGDPVTGEYEFSLTRIENYTNPLFEHLIILPPGQQFWEVHFQNNQIYLVDIFKPYIRVYNSIFEEIDTVTTAKHIWGLTSFSNDCDSVITYATHMGITTEEYRMQGHPDTMMYISQYNLFTNTLTPICQYWMGDNVANTNLTSPLEFLASDPECDLLIDLDLDNSSGVYPYDFIDSTIYCFAEGLPVCDADVRIKTSSPLDSITFELTGVVDGVNEFLSISGSPAGFTLWQRGSFLWTLSGPVGAHDTLYQKALRSVFYNHTGNPQSAGARSVLVRGYNAVKEGVEVVSTLNLTDLPYAGEDVTLFICEDTIIQDLAALTGGMPGTLSPQLIYGANLFNSMSDLSALYHHIVTDVCGTDTALINVIRTGSVQADFLGEDQKLCPGDTVSLSITGHDESTIIWDDGSTDPLRQIQHPGSYYIEVTSIDGCMYHDTIIISAGRLWEPDFIVLPATCELTNGQIAMEAEDFIGGQAVQMDGVEWTVPMANNLASGSYTMTTVSNDGCESQSIIDVQDLPILDIAIDSLVAVASGEWQEVELSIMNGVAVSSVYFLPSGGIRWTGSSLEVYGGSNQIFEVTFIDEYGCEVRFMLQVKVEKSKGIYLPNIFNPQSQSGNAVWEGQYSDVYQLDVLRIYDRWGSVVWQTSEDLRWDGNSSSGKSCLPGVYVYQVHLRNISSHEIVRLHGDVTLVR